MMNILNLNKNFTYFNFKLFEILNNLTFFKKKEKRPWRKKK